MFVKSGLVALALVTVTSGAPSAATQGTPQEQVQTPASTSSKPATAARAYISGFTDGVWSWKPDGRDAILIKSLRGKWYRANLMGACDDLRFSTAIGFIPGPGGDIDRFSSILIDGQRCPFRTFDRVEAPVRATKTAS